MDVSVFSYLEEHKMAQLIKSNLVDSIKKSCLMCKQNANIYFWFWCLQKQFFDIENIMNKIIN